MKKILTILLLCLSVLLMQAQITIGGNVYGGGNAGDMMGNTTVTVYAGDINGSVFGGARMANVDGQTFVNIDGARMSGDILINYVYGGNDISGIIKHVNNESTTTPFTPKTTAIDYTYNAFIQTTSERKVTTGEGQSASTTQPYKIFIGQLYGGGNGDYDYTKITDGENAGKYRVTKTENETTTEVAAAVDAQPEIDRTYLELNGGTIAHVYGGGNAATVKKNTTICIDNTSEVTTSVTDASGTDILNDEEGTRLKAMGINTTQIHASSADFQFGRVFGGNNKVAMDIRPTWHLKSGKIRDLYSGGNAGDMTYPNGIFLAVNSDDMEVDNVYGGCRMADVNPDNNSITAETIEGVDCPAGYAARVHIGGGNINNVYGGNDVSGMVYGGNAVGIHSSIRGNVYGGGNGSYYYTDNSELRFSDLYRDYYYPTPSGKSSVEALNDYRPNAEAVSVRLIGTESKPTIIGGSVYCGGNSATLRSSNSQARAELKIGSYVYADNVFLGSNGENMITEDILKGYAGNVTIGSKTYDFSQMDLKNDADQFATYMKGCEMNIKPRVVFDPSYVNYTTYFGSFYCGGNVGSVMTNGMNTVDFNYNVVIFNKLVGGCNNAYVPATQYNAAFEGGLIGAPDAAPEGKIGNKLKMNLSGLEIRPMRWKDENDKSKLLEWNVVKTGTNEKDETWKTMAATGESDDNDLDRRLFGGNIYGGCYSSGHVNGNVIININATLMDPNVLFDKVTEDSEGEAVLYGDNVLEQDEMKYNIEERRTGVILGRQGMDVLGSALNVFGGGKGKGTEIWGSTTINLNKGYTFQIFGGSEEGVIGKSTGTSTADDYTYDEATGKYAFNGKQYENDANYSCTVNLKGGQAGVSKTSTENHPDMADCEFIYGGGFLGPICGNTIVNLGNGRLFNSFAGSCNADILGHTETYVGRQIQDNGTVTGGFPFVRDYVYGGNDLGGRILNTADFTNRIRNEVAGLTLPGQDAAKEVSAYMEYAQGHALGLFGGCYGTYDYTDSEYREFFNADGTAKSGYTKPRMDNAFVNFRPTLSNALLSNSNNKVTKIYGSGQGYPGDSDRDIMQDRSYILIDIPQTMTNYSSMEVFGAGAWSGLGMRTYVAPTATPDATEKAALDKVSAIIDLPRGQINAVYGGSYEEGFTRRTVVNVPAKSTIKLNKLFGGAYGIDNNTVCDVYETNVTWSSVEGRVGSIYGGNNNARRTLYGRVNINSPVWSDTEKGYMASVYGAGFGEDCWSQYTEVNLNKGSQVYIVYGGGENGRVSNVATAKQEYGVDKLKIADPYTVGTKTYTYADNGLDNDLAKPRHDGKKYNTNVIINKGAIVGSYVAGYTPGFYVTGGYAYGGGMGSADKNRSGDVNGTTYIALLGGNVEKDLVAAGSVGSVFDRYGGLTDDFGQPFEASTTVYVAAGVVRNVFGGGYMGSVGKHKTTTTLMKDGEVVKDKNNQPVMIEVDADLNASTTGDIPAQANVIIGIREDQTAAKKQAAMDYVTSESNTNGTEYGFFNGVPAIQRNVYGGGEGEEGKGGRGGAVFGTANVVLNNGRIGYDYLNDDFVEKLNDETWTVSDSIGRLKDYGNIFGGGYSDKSNVDETNIKIWGGIIRGSVHGGGEIAAVGRGSTKESGDVNHVREFEGIYRAGKTHVEMYNGHVLRNIFGGGKGYNVLGFGGSNDLYTDGYVFGQTEVFIHGGEIGTAEAVRDGYNYGNVFGGGDLGYVYSMGYDNQLSRKTETGSPNHYYYYYNDGNENKLIEDCKVVVSPYLQVKKVGGIEINGHTHPQFDYVETDDLNILPKDKNAWIDLYTGDKLTTDDTKERGVLIHNAVFGGGNVSSNSDTHYANATTVFGNTTATLYDCYHRDFITVGTEHTGGLYGGGNLSVVEGYRELNVTNYGTDYYGLSSRITLEEYRDLSNRERAYFQLEYVCKGGVAEKIVDNVTKYGVYIGGEFYENGQRVKEDDFEKLKNKDGFNAANWEQFGFCSIYAGRLLNTIQRADFCGVYGSRMVLQGAKDRVAEVGEDIDYTINRVGELSLNKQRSMISTDTGAEAEHGNYFGIYSVVNYLGNLTSDVKFGDPYVDSDGHTVSGQTYYSYKKARPTGNDRNYGTSPNQVALASGVFLELTTEKTETNPNKEKEYGYITGVIELDLINVKRATEGGGFVYAKNEHRVPLFYPNKKNVILSEYNNQKIISGQELRDEARTYKQYRYSSDQEGDWTSSGSYIISGDAQENLYKEQDIETSGNFIHPSNKRIVDDCYPINNAYIIGEDPYSKAHYWYVKGSVYVYDQVVSAYTGSANAYSKDVHLPLTITAASNGRLKLLNVKPNLYAYYFEEGKKIGTNGNDGKAWVNNNSDMYQLNDVITWWDWNNLSVADKKLFVPETVVNCKPCKIDGTEYAVGEYVMLPTDINTFKTATHTITDVEGNAFENEQGQAMTYNAVVDDLFRMSNNIGHDSGYVLTFDMDTPKVWDDWYSPVSGASTYTGNSTTDTRITKVAYDALTTGKNSYVEGPTFSPKTTDVYGQRDYAEGDIVTKAVYDKTESGYGKEKMDEAYVATETVSYTYKGTNKTVNPGTAIPLAEYNTLSSSAQSVQSAFAKAFVCIGSLKLAEEKYLLNGDLLTAGEIAALKTTYTDVPADEIDAVFTEAYICTETGKYGGQKYFATNNYSAKESWCSLSESDRIDEEGEDKFIFNYDALDLFADPNYLDFYDETQSKTTEQAYHSPYSDQVPVEYSAVYKEDTSRELHFTDGTTRTFTKGATLSRTEFESIRNDKRYYARIETSSTATVAYIAIDNFTDNGEPYGRGQVVDVDVYTANPGKVKQVTDLTPGTTTYYCLETHNEGSTEVVKEGDRIDENKYNYDLIDDQQYFTIQGQEPTETTTLYVNRESDIRDLTTEKVITVVYQYTYYENGDNGDIKLTNELHVVNIHLQLESGAPSIGTLNEPPIVLPGSAVGLDRPEVRAGIYEVLINGWELYSNKNDADHHRNGVPFVNNSTPVYWYQNMDHYIAFYSKTYLGKTYSNCVPVRVANYHDLGDIMERYKENHLYIDRADVDRPCKIYVNDYSSLSNGDPRKDKNGLDELKNLFDLSLLTPSESELDENGLIKSGTFVGHAPLDSHVKGAENLDIILRTDIDGSVPEGSPARTSIAAGIEDTDPCFGGNLHGDGHTISGLTSSLFGKLCGNVYNLGVTGSFTSAGVADAGDGFVENCWVKSDATALPDGASKVNAVFGNPNDPEHPGCTQVVNCYYPESNAALYNDNGSAANYARKMSDKAFYDGELTYNLNGFYLGKRYYDGSGLTSGKSYQYFPANVDGTLPTNETGTQNVTSTSYYPATYTYYTPQGTAETPKLGYVEHRFYDGDFRYADGTIPEGYNIRRQESGDLDVDGNKIVTWAPIWPDDYLFFGQTLTYGYVEGSPHQDLPSIINKANERLLTTEGSNRVYRAPAYFRSGKMQMTHFNSNAVFAQTMNGDATKIAHKGMTAIDFTGGNGDVVANGYKVGLQTSAPYNNIEGGAFYPPLLDDGGLTAFQNVNLTKNLLVYTAAKSTDSEAPLTASLKTANVVSAKLHDFAYEEGDAIGEGYVAGKETYRTVAEWDRSSNYDQMSGHWVQKSGDGYISTLDHFLVDKHDFNAPIKYQFTGDKRMWYQRTPDKFVDIEKGWDGVSLPFTADIVTTNVKGEITHFYSGSASVDKTSKTKVGHEYWLREFKEGGTLSSDNKVYTANFEYPTGTAADDDKTVTNTFLWDYYYEAKAGHNLKDANNDTYQTYYNDSRTYNDYARLTSGIPYIIGFPGATYYEFDLSGNFSPAHTAGWSKVDKDLAKQVITFASAENATIEVSDGATGVQQDKYAFMPSYLNMELEAGTNSYVLASDGGSYDKVPAEGDAVKVDAFRPYFVEASTGNGAKRRMAERIIFDMSDTSFAFEDHDPTKGEVGGELRFYTQKLLVGVESSLQDATDVLIINTGGQTIASFTIQPGETIETQIPNTGVYIIRAAGGKYNKKITVK